MAAKRLSLPTLAAALVGALGWWAAAGGVALLGSGPSSGRIGVLPPLSWLACALVAAVAVVLVADRIGARAGALAVGVVTLLPWLPGPVPAAFLVWAGPVAAWTWIFIAAAMLARPIAGAAPSSLRRLVADPRRAPAIAAIVAAVLYLAAARHVSPQLPTGDEPHYLVITQSLLIDHDLKIENNHRRGDYHAYYAGELRPDYLKRGVDEQIYSIHAPGLPVLVLPAFALFGYPGVVALLSLLSAIGTAVAWRATWRATNDATASWFGWAAVALSVPFFFQSFIVYPDAPGGVAVMFAVATLLRAEDVSDRRLFVTGCLLAGLPWLHTRFSIASAVLAFLILARLYGAPRWPRRATALLTAPFASAIGWLGFFYAIYGVADPRAPYGGYTQSAVANLARGVPGLLFDQQFGLLPNAPVYLCAAAGLWILSRRTPRVAAELVAVAFPYGLAVAAYFMWWGGFSSPARFLTPVLLPFSIAAGAWYHASGRAGRALGHAALAVSLAETATIACVDRGALLYNSRDGASKLLTWLSPLVNLTTAAPSLFQGTAGQALTAAAVWSLALAAVALAAVIAARRMTAPSALAATATAGIVAASIALTANWRSQAVDARTPDRSAMALLARVDADRPQVAVGIDPPSRLARSALLSSLTLADVAPATIAAGEPAVVLRDLPPAAYDVEVHASSAPSGRVMVTVDNTFGPQWTWDVAPATTVRTITLPVPLAAAIVDLDAAARRAVDRIVVRPARALKAKERLASSRPVHAARYGRAVVFQLDGDAFMEDAGIWVAGSRSATFSIMREQSKPGEPLRVFVRTPPVANRIVLTTGSWGEAFALPPGGERLFEIPVPAGALGVSLRVSASAGATPTAYERGSTDTRFLGCWIEVR